MFWVDIGTLALLVGAVALWWYRSLSRRLVLLTGLAIVTATVSAGAMLNFRWQAGPSVLTAVLLLAFLLAGRFRPRVVTQGWGYATCGVVLSGLTGVAQPKRERFTIGIGKVRRKSPRATSLVIK